MCRSGHACFVMCFSQVGAKLVAASREEPEGRRAISIVVVDDFAAMRHFLSSLLNQRPGFQVIGQAGDGLDAVRTIAELRPDIVLLDIGLPGISGIEVARRSRSLSPNSTVIILTAQDNPGIVDLAFEAGASAYVLKADAVTELLSAIDAILAGKKYCSKGIKGHRSVED